jgi:hypothetical protein
MKGTSTRIGTYKCYECRLPFTVKIGTIFEGSHLLLNLWLQAIHLVHRSKIGSVQLVRTLGITPRTAKYMLRRLGVVDRQSGSADIRAKSNGSRRRDQRARFVATAREYCPDGSVKDFEKAFMRAVQPKRVVSYQGRRRGSLPRGEAARYL